MNNLSISLGKRQLVDSIWKSAGIEGLLVEFYENNDSTDIKAFFRKDCLLLNPGYKQENVL